MKPCKLTMRWAGEPPLVGHWLKAPKGHTAYEITGIRHRGPAALPGHNLVLTCARHAPSDIPEGATVYEIRWSKRSRHDFRRRK